MPDQLFMGADRLAFISHIACLFFVKKGNRVYYFDPYYHLMILENGNVVYNSHSFRLESDGAVCIGNVNDYRRARWCAGVGGTSQYLACVMLIPALA